MSENMMRYKGYVAKVSFSDANGCLIGKVVGIDDSVTFEAESVGEIRKEFHVALDDYLSYCEKIGKKPDRPYSGKLNLRLPSDRHRDLANQAEATGQSINDVILAAIDIAYPVATVEKPKPKSRRSKTAKKR